MWINGNNNTKTYWDAWNAREEEWRKKCDGLLENFRIPKNSILKSAFLIFRKKRILQEMSYRCKIPRGTIKHRGVTHVNGFLYLKSPLGYTFRQILRKRFLYEIILDLSSGAHTGKSQKKI